MNETIGNETERIIEKSHYDDEGTLIGQDITDIVTKKGSQSIHRTVRQVIRFRNDDGKYQERVLAEVMAVIPDYQESDKLVKYLAYDIKKYLSAFNDEFTPVNKAKQRKDSLTESQIPVLA